VAAKIASDRGIMDRTRFVYYTPLEETFRFKAEKAIVFTGTNDPWVGRADSSIPEYAADHGYPCFVVTDANHSLETGDTVKDIENLQRVIKETEQFIAGKG